MAKSDRILEAAALIADRLAVEPESAAWVARKLDAADLIELNSPTSLHLARLLIGIMGASRPGDAPQIVRALEAAPFAEAWMLDGSGQLRRLTRAELAEVPTAAAILAAIDRSAVAFLADLIGIATRFRQDGARINAGRLEVGRDPGKPMLRVWGVDDATETSVVLVWRGGNADPLADRLQVIADASGDVIHDLGKIATAGFAPVLAEHFPIGA